jgi:hypothetical protein
MSMLNEQKAQQLLKLYQGKVDDLERRATALEKYVRTLQVALAKAGIQAPTFGGSGSANRSGVQP